MSTFLTNKEIILEIREAQKEMAQKQLTMALDMSNFMNKQQSFNENISSLLEKMEQNQGQSIEDINTLKKKAEVFAGKIKIVGIIFGGICVFIGWLSNIFLK
jgi:glutamine synthetase adenylyltransferase